MHLACAWLRGLTMSISDLSAHALEAQARFRFCPAALDETSVYGARRPGYPSRLVDTALAEEWTSFISQQGIKRVCCLLDVPELHFYETDLLELYRRQFGMENVCWAPVPDFHLSDERTLNTLVLPF